jgi:hypothetical protein
MLSSRDFVSLPRPIVTVKTSAGSVIPSELIPILIIWVSAPPPEYDIGQLNVPDSARGDTGTLFILMLLISLKLSPEIDHSNIDPGA